MKRLLLFISLLTVFAGKTTVKNKVTESYTATVLIQPYNNFTEEEINSFIVDLQNNMVKYLNGKWKIRTLKPKKIPFSPVIAHKYKASDFLNLQTDKNRKRNEILIGVTHVDICKDIHGKKNYGIVGLSYCPGNNAIVSDCRLRYKKQIWKPIIHEFMHAFYGAKHCPNDDPKCFLVDAKGHGNFVIQNKLCNSCKK